MARAAFVLVIRNPVALPVILLGILSIMHGRLNQHRVLREAD